MTAHGPETLPFHCRTCPTTIPPGLPFCRRCWWYVPETHKKAIRRTQAWAGQWSPAYLVAMVAAARAVGERRSA